MSDESSQTNANSEQTPPLGQPIRERPAPQPVRSQPVQTAERPVDVRRTIIVEERESNLGEYLKFGVLALILLGTPIVIALLIPLIFGQIVPAVLGSNLPTDTPLFPGDQVVEPDTGGTPAGLSPTDPNIGIGGEVTTVVVTPPSPLVTPGSPVTYVVQTGDTLASIARQYGVSADEIAAANNIQNPNQIFVGSILVIPQPAAP